MQVRQFLSVCLLVLVSSTCAWAVPTQVTVQGKVTDAGGSPLPAGAKTFTFRIFDAPLLGTQLWPASGGEIQSITTSTDGLWIGLVGAVSPLNDSVFADSVRWLEIDVNGTTLPRVRLVTGPYAFRVATIDGASGGTITTKVSIGPGHTNDGKSAFVAGENNTVDGDYATVGGGTNNHAPGLYSVIGGGSDNTVGLINTTVGGGALNTAGGAISTVAGGKSNVAEGSASSIGGGESNHADGDHATVAGGNTNDAPGISAVVGGGDNNSALLIEATVGGGGGNVAGGITSTVGGGIQNTASGTSSTVPGGESNEADGAYSFAAGWRAKARDGGCFVWADSTDADFVSTGKNQFLVRASGGVGINTTTVSNVLTLPNLASSAGRGLANAWSTYSSRRWKDSIETIANPLALVEKLRGARFAWKTNGKRDIGLIAEEVGRVVPEVVEYEENGVDAKSVDYSRLVAVLIEGMKAQQNIIDSLRTRVSNLETRP